MTSTAKGSGATVLFTELFKVGWADQTENEGLYYREGEGWPLCTNFNKCIFLMHKFRSNIILAKTIQCNAVKCVFYYMKTNPLLLGILMYKPYCSKVHLLNKNYLQFWPTLLSAWEVEEDNALALGCTALLHSRPVVILPCLCLIRENNQAPASPWPPIQHERIAVSAKARVT